MSVKTEMAEAAALEAGLPVLIAIPLAWLAIGWALARVFGRLLLVERQIAARGVESIDPIPVGDVPAEVLPLVQAMNDLIGRIRWRSSTSGASSPMQPTNCARPSPRSKSRSTIWRWQSFPAVTGRLAKYGLVFAARHGWSTSCSGWPAWKKPNIRRRRVWI